MYEAFETQGARRVTLAHEALEISPDCADAYLLLAEEATSSLEEARELLEQGVAAGERALGPEPFEGDVGYFWGLIETRPYMRARAALAETLWALGGREEAVAHQRELLRLNPNDNGIFAANLKLRYRAPLRADVSGEHSLPFSLRPVRDLRVNPFGVGGLEPRPRG